jgi:hypothetical protein
MSVQNDNGFKSFLATAALGAFRRVKNTAGSGTYVEYAGAGEQHIGVTQLAAAILTEVTVKVRSGPGTFKVIAADDFAAGATLYGAATGYVSDTSSGSAIGIALEAAAGSGSVIEMLGYQTLSTTAAGVSIADAGNFTATATVEAALQEVYQHVESIQKFLPLPIGANCVDATFTPLALWVNAASTVPGVYVTNDKAGGVKWNDNAAPGVFWTWFPIPMDLDPEADVILHIIASKVGATLGDAVTFLVAAYEQAVGALHDADTNLGGTSSAMTGDATSKTVQHVTLTLGLANIHTGPETITMSIKPTTGTLGTDDVIIHGAYLQYKGRLLTS